MSLNVEIKAEIPSTSSGKLVDAATDIVRFVSEPLGLVADYILLARQEVLKKIAIRARAIIEIENKSVQTLPLKTLYPLLEKASLEDIDDDVMLDLWSGLLSSSVISSNTAIPRYISILGEMTKEQGLLLDRIVRGETNNKIDSSGEIAARIDLIENHYLRNLAQNFESISKDDNENYLLYAKKTCAILLDALKIRGSLIKEIKIRQLGSSYVILNAPVDIPPPVSQVDQSVLESLGLIRRFNSRSLSMKDVVEVDIDCLFITAMGADLYACCNPKKLKRQ